MSDKAPIKMLHDRLLVEDDRDAGERRTSGGIVIPATAAMGARRLVWSRVAAGSSMNSRSHACPPYPVRTGWPPSNAAWSSPRTCSV